MLLRHHTVFQIYDFVLFLETEAPVFKKLSTKSLKNVKQFSPNDLEQEEEEYDFTPAENANQQESIGLKCSGFNI